MKVNRTLLGSKNEEKRTIRVSLKSKQLGCFWSCTVSLRDEKTSSRIFLWDAPQGWNLWACLYLYGALLSFSWVWQFCLTSLVVNRTKQAIQVWNEGWLNDDRRVIFWVNYQFETQTYQHRLFFCQGFVLPANILEQTAWKYEIKGSQPCYNLPSFN